MGSCTGHTTMITGTPPGSPPIKLSNVSALKAKTDSLKFWLVVNLFKIYTSLAHTNFICGILHMSHNKHFSCQGGILDTKDQECPKPRELDLFYLETEKSIISVLLSAQEMLTMWKKKHLGGNSPCPLCLKNRCLHQTEDSILT